MNKFIALTRVNLQMALYQLSLVRRRTGRREGRGFQMGLGVIVVIIMAYWGFMSWMLTGAFNKQGLPWLMLVIGMLIVSLLIMGLGMYSFNSLLFESADTDQLFAMPISKLKVVLGKVSGVVVENWVIALIFWLPMTAVYAAYAHPGAVFYLFAALTLLIVPGVPLFVLGLISYLVGLLASGSRFRRVLQIGLTIVLMAAIGVGLRQSVAHLMATAKINPGPDLQDQFFSMMQRYYPPVGYAIDALVTGSWGAMALATLWNVVPFVLLYLLIAKSYAWIRTRITTVHRVTSGRVSYDRASAARALYRKELGRLTGSSMYMMQACIGGVLVILFAFLFSIRTGKNAAGMQDMLQSTGLSMTYVMLLAFLFLLSIANTTAPSISLEGQNLWVVQSLPFDTAAVLRAKLLVQLTVITPLAVIGCFISIFTVGIGWDGFVILALPCVLWTVVSACVGLIFNLHYHRFDFYNDMQVAKNSASVLLTYGTMVVGLIVVSIAFLIGFARGVSFYAFWGALLGVLVSAAVLLYRYLMTTGVQLFRRLNG